MQSAPNKTKCPPSPTSNHAVVLQETRRAGPFWRTCVKHRHPKTVATGRSAPRTHRLGRLESAGAFANASPLGEGQAGREQHKDHEPRKQLQCHREPENQAGPHIHAMA